LRNETLARSSTSSRGVRRKASCSDSLPYRRHQLSPAPDFTPQLKRMNMKQFRSVVPAVVSATLLASSAGIHAVAQETKHEFSMVRAAKVVASRCLPNAAANVTVKPQGPVEVMDVNVSGLPANTDFDFFVIQKPGAPFGLAWYQGDIETD